MSLGTSFGNVELLEGAKEVYMVTKLTKIQEFYGITFEDLFEEEAMKSKGISEEDLQYVLENRETEFARKSKEAWEMKRGLFESKRWLKLKDFYGISERDIRDVETMKLMGIPKEDIAFITGKEEIPKEEFSDLDNLKREATDLGIEFNPRIGEVKLKEKIEAFKQV